MGDLIRRVISSLNKCRAEKCQEMGDTRRYKEMQGDTGRQEVQGVQHLLRCASGEEEADKMPYWENLCLRF